MLLQALARYADSDLKADLADEAFESKPVPYGVEIDEQGRFRGLLSDLKKNRQRAARRPKAIASHKPW